MKRLIAFDLDGTLAASKQPLEPEMADLLACLSHVADICVISGVDWPQFKTQVVARLGPEICLGRLWIMPTSGTKLYRYQEGEWRCMFADLLSEGERMATERAIAAALTKLGINEPRLWGEQVEDRGTQITFSALGQQAPLEAKQAWDPDRRKREALRTALAGALPDLSVRTGGSTSVDITRKGVDKAYGMARLIEWSGIPATAILFLGDALYPGGNDAPVREAGIDAIQVSTLGETARAIEAVILCLKH